MERVKVDITAVSPLSLGTFKSYGGTLIESARFISGSLLRGAVGSSRQSHRDDVDALCGDGLRPGVRFPNCYPSDGSLIRHTPMTAMSCKHHPGFKGDDENNNPHHGAVDLLTRHLAYDTLNPPGEPARWNISLPFHYICQYAHGGGCCNGRVDQFSEFYLEKRPHQFARMRAYTHRLTRAAINRGRLTAEDEMLYTVEALNEQQRFVGVTHITEELVELFIKYVRSITLIGGRTSRGFGEVEIMATAERDSALTINERVEMFNCFYQKFYEELRKIKLPGREENPPHKGMMFTINLESTTILRTLEGLPSLLLTPAMLKEAMGIAPDEGPPIELVTHYVSHRMASGWHTAWGLPKEVLLGTEPGSIYVFRTDDYESLAPYLQRLEELGLGLWREDGYGQVTVCHPFHLEVNPI